MNLTKNEEIFTNFWLISPLQSRQYQPLFSKGKLFFISIFCVTKEFTFSHFDFVPVGTNQILLSTERILSMWVTAILPAGFGCCFFFLVFVVIKKGFFFFNLAFSDARLPKFCFRGLEKIFFREILFLSCIIYLNENFDLFLYAFFLFVHQKNFKNVLVFRIIMWK